MTPAILSSLSWIFSSLFSLAFKHVISNILKNNPPKLVYNNPPDPTTTSTYYPNSLLLFAAKYLERVIGFSFSQSRFLSEHFNSSFRGQGNLRVDKPSSHFSVLTWPVSSLWNSVSAPPLNTCFPWPSGRCSSSPLPPSLSHSFSLHSWLRLTSQTPQSVSLTSPLYYLCLLPISSPLSL